MARELVNPPGLATPPRSLFEDEQKLTCIAGLEGASTPRA